jgi:hypothetical protein
VDLLQWTRAATAVGLSTVLCFVFLGVFLGMIPSPLVALPQIRDDLRLHIKQSTDQQAQQTAEALEAVRVLRQICRAVSKSEIGLMNCDASRR